MPTKNPRINVCLDIALYQSVRMLAEKDNISLSAEVKNLLKDAVESHEDIYLAELASEREKSWDEAASLSHDDLWD